MQARTNRFAQFIYLTGLCLVIGLILGGCLANQSETWATSTQPKALPSERPQFSHTPTVTLKPAFTVTSTIKPDNTPTLHISTKASSSLSSTPTPEALYLPSTGPEFYKLREWTLQDRLAVLASTESEQPNSEFNLDQNVRRFKITLLLETVKRFSDAEINPELKWKLAQYEAMDRSDYPTTDFQESLQAGLNSGTIRIAGNQNNLSEKGFSLLTSLNSTNIFGDGRDALVLLIVFEGENITSSSSIWVLTGDRPGEFRLYPLGGRWIKHHFEHHVSIKLNDFNGNGRDEIALSVTECGHATCVNYLEFYEWDGNDHEGIINVIFHAVTFGDFLWYPEENDIWKFGAHQSSGVKTITAEIPVHNERARECYYFINYYEFSWGDLRPKMSLTPLDSSKPIYCNVEWADYAATFGHYQEAIQVLKPIVETWDQLDLSNSIALSGFWGQGARDYLRIKLGTWYFFNGQFNQGVHELKSVRDAPTSPNFEMIPQIAGVFLDQYSKGYGTDAACKAVIAAEDLTLSTMPGYPFVNGIVLTESWGFSDYGWFEVGPNELETSCSKYDPSSDKLVSGSMGGAETSYPIPDRFFQAEALIFAQKYDEAFIVIDELQSVIETETITDTLVDKPRLLYITGLMYEMSGDAKKAVEYYWLLWNDFPDSLYAIIARSKLIIDK